MSETKIKYIISVDKKIVAGGYQCLCYSGNNNFSTSVRYALRFDTRKEAGDKLAELKATMPYEYCGWYITGVQR
jgi:hypothetical protein